MATVNGGPSVQTYCTPPEFLAAVTRRFGAIEFDAACDRDNRVAPLGYVHPDIDALSRDWSELGNRLVFCNPPWAQAGKFARCARKGSAKHTGPRVLLLCQAAVDSEWYAQNVHGHALVLALRPRIPFLNADGTAPAFVDKRGKALGVNRPAMLACYGFGQVGFEPWAWMRADR